MDDASFVGRRRRFLLVFFFFIKRKERKSRRIFLLRPPATSWCGVPDVFSIFSPSGLFRLCIIVLERVLGLLSGHNPDEMLLCSACAGPTTMSGLDDQKEKKRRYFFKVKDSKTAMVR